MSFSKKHEFHVYALLDTRKKGPFWYGHWKFEYEPFYIGKGKWDRLQGHLLEAINGYKTNLFKNAVIKKIIKKTGKNPFVAIKSKYLTEKQAFELEIRLISHIGRRDLKEGPLTNLTDGGEGSSGVIPSAKTLLKRGKGIHKTKSKRDYSGKNAYWYGRKHTKKSLLKMSKNSYWNTHTHTKKSRLKISKSKKGISNEKCRESWDIVSPTGKKYTTDNLKEFCIKKKINYLSLLSWYKWYGWTIYNKTNKYGQRG